MRSTAHVAVFAAILCIVAPALGADDALPKCLGGTSLHNETRRGVKGALCKRPDGTPHGPALARHPNGRLFRRAMHRNGQLHGEMRTWREDGSLKLVASFSDGRQHGLWTYHGSGGRPERYQCFAEAHWAWETTEPEVARLRHCPPLLDDTSRSLSRAEPVSGITVAVDRAGTHFRIRYAARLEGQVSVALDGDDYTRLVRAVVPEGLGLAAASLDLLGSLAFGTPARELQIELKTRATRAIRARLAGVYIGGSQLQWDPVELLVSRPLSAALSVYHRRCPKSRRPKALGPMTMPQPAAIDPAGRTLQVTLHTTMVRDADLRPWDLEVAYIWSAMNGAGFSQSRPDGHASIAFGSRLMAQLRILRGRERPDHKVLRAAVERWQRDSSFSPILVPRALVLSSFGWTENVRKEVIEHLAKDLRTTRGCAAGGAGSK